jgi:hypothetical protein
MKSAFRILLTSILLISANSIMAQDEEAPAPQGFDRSKLFFGGNFGLSFGNFTLINVSPQVGYRFNRTFAAGTGVNFQYSGFRTRYENSIYDYKESYGVAGLNIFGRIYPLDFLLLQVQPELNYTWGKLRFYNGAPEQKLDGKIVPSVLAGAGAAIPAGRGVFLAMLQYDLLQQERSPYGSRVFYNFGYNFGF